MASSTSAKREEGGARREAHAQGAPAVAARSEAEHEGGDDGRHRIDADAALQGEDALPGHLVDEARGAAGQEGRDEEREDARGHAGRLLRMEPSSAESPPRDRRWGNLPAHGPDVGAELAAVMDGVEEDEPEEFPDRHLHDHLAAREELALAIPTRVVESRHLAVQLVPVLLEGGGRFLDAGDRRRFPLPAARARELAAGGVLEHERRRAAPRRKATSRGACSPACRPASRGSRAGRCPSPPCAVPGRIHARS